VIITELDKAWVRAATAKLIRQGKLKRRPCEICGARETLVHHIDYSDPEHIKWLCKRHKSEEQLSPLQRSLLRRGLLAWHSKALAIDCQLSDPDSFKLGSLITDFEDRRERASRRAAAGLSLSRLIKRGLLERCARGSWRLTQAGLKVAKRLYPDLRPPTKRQLAHSIALRKAMSAWDTHPRPSGKRRRRTNSHPLAPIHIADFEKERPGVEVDLNLSGL
jgi:hypothetical protein